MDFKTLVRTVVVKTNPIFPFSRLNRIPYELAIKSIKQLCAKFPEIKSLYLRHGLTRLDWEPGLSDIDLTLVMSSELSQEEEYDFLQAFMETYHSLKFFYPMLGEIDLISETCCSTWTQFSMRGFEAGNWKLLYGAETVKPMYSQGPSLLRKDALSMAFAVYEEYVLERFYAGDSVAWVEKKSHARIARKVLRYAQDGCDAKNDNGQVSKDDTCSNILLELLATLDALARQALSESDPTSQSSTTPAQLADEEIEIEYGASKFADLQHYESFICSVVLGYSTSFVVLKDGMLPAAAKRALDGIRNICRASGIQPLILTSSMFEYFVREYRPQHYFELQNYRHILFGEDPLPKLTKPAAEAFAQSLLNQSLNIMVAPAYHAYQGASGAMSKHWTSAAWKSMFLKLYLDAGVVGLYERCMGMCQERYSDLCEDIQTLSQGHGSDDRLARLAHALLRQNALDINAKIEPLGHGVVIPTKWLLSSTSEGIA